MKNFTLGLFSYRSKTVMVKHRAEAGTSAPVGAVSENTTLPTGTTDLDQAKAILAKIKGKIFDGNSFAELRKLLEKVATENKSAQADIFKEMDTLINEKTSVLQWYTSGNKNELMQLRGEFDASYKAVEAQKNTAAANVRAGTKKLISKEVEVNNQLDLLSNLNGDKSIDNTDRGFVNERNLKRAISWASHRPGGLGAVYTEVTGKNPDFSPKGIEDFHASLRVSMSVIKQLTNGNAGLDAFLEGQTENFLAEVAKRVKANNNKPLEVRVEDSTKLSPTIHNLLGVAGTVGVAVLTQGVVTFGHQKDAITAEQFIAKEGEDKEGGFFNTLGKAASWVKDAFLGRKLSLTLGRERVADYKKSITEFVKEVTNLKGDTKADSITDPTLRSAFETAIRAANKAKVDLSKPEEFEKIQKALIQSYINGEGFKNEGSNWSASIGLLMLVGVHRDAIGMEALRTADSAYNEAERAVTKMTISKYEGAGITIEKPKTRGGNWIYTIPTELQLPGDDEKMPVKSDSATLSEDGKNYIHTTTQSQHVGLSFRNDEYVLTFSDAMGKMPEVHPETMPVTKLLRDRVTDLKKKPVADLLYSIGHMREFDGLILKLASQDFDGAKAWLENMSKKGKYRTLSKKLLNDVSKKVEMSTWTSYMYGSSKSRAHQEYTQSFANKEVRTSATISAEDRLAKKLGLPTTNEAHFQIGPKEKFVPKQATEIFGERSMTIASFATPKGAAHRLDTYDGSVTMSQKVRIMEDDTEKKAVIEAIWKNTAKNKGMGAELKKLNDFIDTNNAKQWLPVSTPVSIEQYKAYLVSGDMKDLWEIPGLSVKAGFEPKVFEGRAMIAGNVCLNRLYGIIYPSFMLGGIPQQVPPVITADSSTPLNEVTVATTTTDIGVNPIALLNKPKPTEQPSIVTTPGEGKIGSVLVDGRVVGEVTAPGRITIGTTQFRLAPGQTISQFLGEKFASSTYMAAGELSTTQKVLNYLGQFIVATVEGVEGYNEIDINKPQASEKTE